jgi:subtilisin family serine protease
MSDARVLRPCLAALALALVLLAPAAAHAAPERTGRLLVTLDEPEHAVGVRAAAAAVLNRKDVRRDGFQVPQINLVSVRPLGGVGLSALASLLRRVPGVHSVDVEHRASLRALPDDPALTAQDPAAVPGTTVAWWVAKSGLAAAWDVTHGDGATVAVIDTGADSGHPELQGKIVDAIDNDDTAGHGPATGDEHGHGTHVASLACGAGDNAVGGVGSGFDCKLLIIKSDLSDGSIARSIVQAADRGADAINMSFGSDGGPAPQPVVDAIEYAYAKGVILVSAADDRPVEDQGYPSNILQPTGTGADLAAGRGLAVTAANFLDTRASFAGRGSQISLASYGAYESSPGPSGIFSAFPGNTTELETGNGLLPLLPTNRCFCRTSFDGDNRYAYLQGTSMAAPIVAGIAAMARHLNPDASALDVIRALKQSASRPAGSGWNPDLGWGIVNAGAALDAVRAIDRRAPESRLTGRKRIKKARRATLKWTGADTARAPLQASGVAVYEVYRSANRRAYRRVARTRKTRLKVKVKPGSVYRWYTIAVDKAGNREAVPAKPDLSMRIDRRR